MRGNLLSGPVPDWIGNLRSLTTLGSIPRSLGNLSNVDEITFSYNNFTGTLPSELGQLSKLTRLGVDSNDITGQIPDTFVNLKNLTEFGPYPIGLPIQHVFYGAGSSVYLPCGYIGL
eukprot:jgi/Hompol1/3675/HPOL_006731-RA